MSDDADLFGDDEAVDNAEVDNGMIDSADQDEAAVDEDLFGDNVETDDVDASEPVHSVSGPRGAEVTITARVQPATNDGRMSLTKFPSVLAIERQPFDAATFVSDPAQHARTHNTPAHNIIRWRHSADSAAPESNARLVRWPDGSMQLWIGKQAMEISEHPLAAEHHLYSQIAPSVHQCVGAFGSRLVIKPNEFATAQKRLESKLRSIRAIDAVKVKRSAKLAAESAAAEAIRAAQHKAERESETLQRRKEAARARGVGSALAKFNASFLEQTEDDAVAAHARDYADDDEVAQRRLARAKDTFDENSDEDIKRRPAVSRRQQEESQDEEDDDDDDDDEGEYNSEEVDDDYAEGDSQLEDNDDEEGSAEKDEQTGSDESELDGQETPSDAEEATDDESSSKKRKRKEEKSKKMKLKRLRKFDDDE